jgi:hypothetical protein
MQEKENIEYRATNIECRRKSFVIRYFLRVRGKFMIHELPAAKGKTSAFDIR